VATLQGPPAAAAAAAPSAAVGGMMQVLEGTAQEVFRVLLFLVFTLEVFLISLLPFVGETAAANSVFGNRCQCQEQSTWQRLVKFSAPIRWLECCCFWSSGLMCSSSFLPFISEAAGQQQQQPSRQYI
jgi:hypothetical protein